MRSAIAKFSVLAAAAMLLAGCAKHTNTIANPNATTNPNAVASGPVSDSGDTGLRSSPSAATAMGDPKAGATIFGQNCAACHGAGGAGGGIGPRLIGEKQRKNYQQAIAWIKNPQPPMPKLYPAPLSESDVADVAAYVETL